MKIISTIYLDHQATTPVDPRVLPKMTDTLCQKFGNPHSSEHAIGWRAGQAVETAAFQVGSLVGADADEVIFTSGATEANNLALLGLAGHARASGRRRVLLGATEHKSVIGPARVLASHHNLEVVVIEVDRNGRIDMDALEASVAGDTLLISIMAVNNEIGTVQDVARIGALARDAGALFHCDAAQAPCAIDVGDLIDNADLISLSGHKIYGPCGIGALIARRDVQPMISPLIHGGVQQNGLRSGTLPLALCVGFGAAAELIGGEDAVEERKRVRNIRDLFVRLLIAAGHDIELNGGTGDARHPGNANLLMRGVAAADLLASMQPKLAASSGSACTSGIPEPSHVLRAIGLSAQEADSSVRFSFGRHSTEADAREAATIVSETLDRLSEAGLRTIA